MNKSVKKGNRRKESVNVIPYRHSHFQRGSNIPTQSSTPKMPNVTPPKNNK